MPNDSANTRRCQGITSQGKRCEKIVGPAHTLCFLHDPTRASERSELASKAARTKYATPRDEILEIRSRLREIAEEVRAGKLTTARGSVVSQVYGVLLKTFSEERKEKELAELEQRLQEVERMHSRKRDMPTDDNPFDVGGGWAR